MDKGQAEVWIVPENRNHLDGQLFLLGKGGGHCQKNSFLLGKIDAGPERHFGKTRRKFEKCGLHFLDQ